MSSWEARSEIVRCEISQLSGAGINLDPGIAQHGSIAHKTVTRLSIKIFKKCWAILIQNSLLRENMIDTNA